MSKVARHKVRLMRHLKKSARRKSFRLTALIFVLAFATIGVVYQLVSHAATSAVVIEPENGTVTTAEVVNDSGASNGKAVKFKAATTTPPGQCPTGVRWCDEFSGTTLSLSDTTAHRNWLPSEQGVYDNGHNGGGSFSWEWTPKGNPELNLWTVKDGVLTMKAIRNDGCLLYTSDAADE